MDRIIYIFVDILKGFINHVYIPTKTLYYDYYYMRFHNHLHT
jgi:hypothetical protein